MLAAPTRAWSVFQQIFAEHWEAFQHTHPRYQTPYYDGLVAKLLACGNPEKIGASITVSATPCSSVYPTARRGGLRGAGGNSTDSSTAVNSTCRHRRMLWAPLQSFHTIGHAL